MKHLRAVCAFTILAAVACAQDSTRPDLRGVWQYRDPKTGAALMDFAFNQSGDSVTVRRLPPEKPDVLLYEGTFENDRVIAGMALRVKGETRWTPVKITIADHDHLDWKGDTLTRATPKDAALITTLHRMSLEQPPLPCQCYPGIAHVSSLRSFGRILAIAAPCPARTLPSAPATNLSR
jgi:hypothetical protein